MTPAAPGPAAVRAIAWAVVSAEIARLRGPGGLPLRALPDALTATLDEAGLGIDSLEQMGVRSALTEIFDLSDDEMPGDERGPATIADWADSVLAAWATREPALVVRSSGTTGGTKPCRHRAAALTAEAHFFAHRVAPRRRVVALVPGHHIYGLIWTVLFPDALGAPVVRASTPHQLALAPGDLVVAVPDQWADLARRGTRLPADVIGVSAAAALAPATATALREAGLARMIEVYGASETGGIGFREAPDNPYELLARWRFASDAAEVVDEDGRAFALPDDVTADGRRFTVGARRDGAVQIGGHNVLPAEVAAILRRHPGVADAAVRLGPSGRLKAFLVPVADQDADALVTGVADFARAHLAAHARPVAYRTGSELPRGPLGKPADWD